MSIFHDGILVDVHVRYWSGAKLLTAEDLGLADSEVSKAFKLGKKDLIPEEVMKQFRFWESKARYAVDSSSFEFPIGHADFLPKRRAEKVFAELETCQAEYNHLIDDLIETDVYSRDSRDSRSQMHRAPVLRKLPGVAGQGPRHLIDPRTKRQRRVLPARN